MDYYWALFGKIAAAVALLAMILKVIRWKRTQIQITNDAHASDPPPIKEALSARLKAYRKSQLEKANLAQAEYDKLVVTLSGGALGVSFTFLKDVAKKHSLLHTEYLFSSWVCWGLSVACILASLYTGILSLRRAVNQVDSGTIYMQRPGGLFALLTLMLNPIAGFLFIFGLVFIIIFVYMNPYG
jgi:hypothetical protein